MRKIRAPRSMRRGLKNGVANHRVRIDPEHRASRRGLDELRGELEPSVEKLYVWGKRYFQQQDLHNALRVWRQVLLIDPNHQNTLENVQRAERMLSRLEEIQTGDS